MRFAFRSMIVAVLLVIASGFAIAKDISKPEREELIKGFVAAMNERDADARRAYILAHYINADSAAAVDRWLGHFSRYSAMFGQFEIHDVNVSDPLRLTANCRCDGRNAVNEWSELILNMDSLDHSRYRTMGLGPGDDPTIHYPDRQLTDDEIVDYVSRYVDRMAERDVFSGTVSIVHDGKEIYSSAHGYADLRWKIPNNIDTKFNLGSMNKMFTSVAIAQLVSEGKLSYDDYLIDVMPDYPNKEVAKKVKIRHLLTHTSGMDSYWDALFSKEWTSVRSVQEFADLTINDTLLFEPGDHFHYSNSGPVILGLVIEHITGMDYHDYIRQYVTGPAGMKGTNCWANDEIVPNLAQGYFYPSPDAKQRISNVFDHSARGGPAGGGFSTVGDLQRFTKALYEGKLIPMAYVDTITTGKVEMGPEEWYGFLFGEAFPDGQRVVGHSGGAPGINANLDIYPDLGYCVAAMSNYGVGAVEISRYAGQLISHGRKATAARD